MENKTLQEHKDEIINNNSLGLSLADILGIILCDNKEFIYKTLEKYATQEE